MDPLLGTHTWLKISFLFNRRLNQAGLLLRLTALKLFNESVVDSNCILLQLIFYYHSYVLFLQKWMNELACICLYTNIARKCEGNPPPPTVVCVGRASILSKVFHLKNHFYCSFTMFLFFWDLHLCVSYQPGHQQNWRKQ